MLYSHNKIFLTLVKISFINFIKKCIYNFKIFNNIYFFVNNMITNIVKLFYGILQFLLFNSILLHSKIIFPLYLLFYSVLDYFVRKYFFIVIPRITLRKI